RSCAFPSSNAPPGVGLRIMVGGGTDIALYSDRIICADDTKIGYPPTRVWGIPAAGMWAHRLGDQRAKRLLFTGDCLTGKQAAEWGLAVESWPADELDARTEALVERIARMPVNQLMMAKLALNSSLLAQGVANSGMVSTVFDGISRHTREGYAFQLRSATTNPHAPAPESRPEMSTCTVITEQRGPVTLIGINRPEVRNAVDLVTASSLADARSPAADTLTGAGQFAASTGGHGSFDTPTSPANVTYVRGAPTTRQRPTGG
ncbi:enoyl-CoA hydratase-related protein, partial [Amycolatopsis sp. NPDC003676]